MSPSMPTGAVLSDEHWDPLAATLERSGAWLAYDAVMQRIRFDGRPPSHPARHPVLADRTITVGSASKELRMIGWRVDRTRWSLFVDTTQLGLTPAEASARLFDRAKVATTPMDGWGPSGADYLRIVFANEPVDRLSDLGARFRAALG